MAIELPRASGGSVGSGGGRARGRLPDAGDVPTVRVASDPGLRVPNFAQSAGTGLEAVGAGLSDVAEELQARQDRLDAADARITLRTNALGRLRAERESNKEVDDLFNATQSTQNFGERTVAEGFGAAVNDIVDKRIANSGLEGEALLDFQITMEGVRSRAVDLGNGAHIKANDDEVELVFGGKINEIAAQIPLGNLTVNEANTQAADFIKANMDAFRPGQEQSFAQRALAANYMAEINKLIRDEQFEEAAEVFAIPEAASALGPEIRKIVFDRVKKARLELLSGGANKARILGKAEMENKGIPKGFVIQQKADGNFAILTKPKDLKGDGPQIMSDEEAATAGLPEGFVYVKTDTSITELFAPPGKTRLMSEGELSAEGFPVGSIVEVSGPPGARQRKVIVKGLEEPVELTDEEKLASGFPKDSVVVKTDGGFNVAYKAASPSETQQRIADLVARGYKKDFATDIARGNIFFHVVPSSGKVLAVDVASGTVTEILPDGVPAGTEPPREEKTLRELIAGGNIAGILPAAQAGINRTVGQIPLIPVFEDVSADRSQMTAAIGLFVNNMQDTGRFSPSEITFLRNIVDIEPQILDSQRDALQRVDGIVVELTKMMESQRESAADTSLSDKDRSGASRASKVIEDFLDRIGPPIDPNSLPPEGIPEFSVNIGVDRAGNQIWETPDGRRLRVFK